MKILIIHQYYLLPGMPGGSRFNELARLWSDMGHSVQVIAGTLDYSTGERPVRYRGRWMTSEQDGPVSVWRCHVPASYIRSYTGRMWAFIAFTLSACCAVLLSRRPDVVLATSPPLVAAIPGWVATRARFPGTPLVFEIRDLWPESAITTGIIGEGGVFAKLLYRLEAFAYRSAALVNVLTPAFQADLLRRRLVPADRVSFVPNGADVHAFAPGARDNEARRELGWGNRFVVLYAGAHGRANAVGQLVEAAALLKDRPDILLACVGDGPERSRWETEARVRQLQNITFHGPQPKERMPAIVQACDVGAAVLQDNPTFRTVYPNKMFDYMACGRPTLLAIDGVARELVCTTAAAGIFVKPESPSDMAAAIRMLADAPAERSEMGARGRAWVLANATRTSLAERYATELARTCSRHEVHRGRWPRYLLKGALDRTLALAGLVVLSPVMLTVAVLVRLFLGRPVLFQQERPGLRGSPFKILKFRTMKPGSEADVERLTPLGTHIRGWSLDELPALWNVVKGEMSLVGPRPLLMQYLPRYSPRQRMRHEMKPGITGWAQVNGRNALSWDEKLELDVFYVENWSLRLDVRILLSTMGRVARRQGITHEGAATMPEFMGPSAP